MVFLQMTSLIESYFKSFDPLQHIDTPSEPLKSFDISFWDT